MRCAVLGDPVAHSLSPALHAAAYAHLGLDWTYQAVQVRSGGLGAFLNRVGRGDEGGGWRGLSLTMPLKREVLDLVIERTPTVDLAGGANTVVLGPAGTDGTDGDAGTRLDNTDLPGAAAAVREAWSGPVRSVAVLGAGATAASIALALCDLGAEQVSLLARDAGRAAASAGLVAGHGSGPHVVVAPLDEGVPGPVDVLVSTVPADAQDAALVRGVDEAGLVFEALYDPWPTPVAAAALSAGRVLVGGLDLLVHQAVLQVEAFTGETVPVGVLREAGERALAARLGDRA